MNPPSERASPLHAAAPFFHLLRIGLGVLFLLSGADKALDPGNFLVAVRSYQILSDPWAPLLALCLPWLELLIGCCLLSQRHFHAALLLSGCLLVIFLVAILSAWMRGLEIVCGCFGPGSGTGNHLHLVGRDLALLIVVMALAWKARLEMTAGN